MPIPGWILYVAMTPLHQALWSVEQVERDAVEPQEVVVLTVIDADHQERDLQFVAFFQHPTRRGGDVEAVIAWRVVIARTLVEPPRARRRQIAVAGTAITLAMAEDREIAGVMRVLAHRRRRISTRLVQKGPHKARARQLRHPMHADLGLLEVAGLLVDLDRRRDEATDRRFQSDRHEERAAHVFIPEAGNIEHVPDRVAPRRQHRIEIERQAGRVLLLVRSTLTWTGQKIGS